MVVSYVNYLSVLLALQATISSTSLIENVPNVEQLGELDGSEIKGDNYIEWPKKPGQRFAKKLECVAGFQLVYKDKYAACCLPGERLVGSFDRVWECCGDGHDLAGSKDTGYSCCPTGQIFDGTNCKNPTPPAPVCQNGKVLVDGKCVCPSGQVDGPDGWCQVVKCESGLKTGNSLLSRNHKTRNYGHCLTCIR